MTMANAMGAWSVTLGAAVITADGAITITVTATDAAMNTASASAMVTVDTVVPTVVIAAPAAMALLNTGAPTITGTAEAGSTVALDFGGGRTASVTADAMGNWSYAVPMGMRLADGPVTVSAVATDGTGNSSTPTHGDVHGRHRDERRDHLADDGLDRRESHARASGSRRGWRDHHRDRERDDAHDHGGRDGQLDRDGSHGSDRRGWHGDVRCFVRRSRGKHSDSDEHGHCGLARGGDDHRAHDGLLVNSRTPTITRTQLEPNTTVTFDSAADARRW